MKFVSDKKPRTHKPLEQYTNPNLRNEPLIAHQMAQMDSINRSFDSNLNYSASPFRELPVRETFNYRDLVAQGTKTDPYM